MKKIVLVLTISALLSLIPSYVKSETLTVTGQIGDTILRMHGFTSPDSLVTFIENNGVKGTIVSTSSGHFEKEFTGQDPGAHTVKMYTTDPDGTNTITTKLSFLLIGFQTLSLQNIYLPPTIYLAATSVMIGETIRITGYTKPLETVKIQIEGPAGSLNLVQADGRGYYYYDLDTTSVSPGVYTVYSVLEVSGSQVSTESQKLTFTIEVLPTATPTTAASPEMTATPTPRNNSATPTITPITSTEDQDKHICQYTFIRLCFFDTNKNRVIDFTNELKMFLLGFSKSIGSTSENIYDLNEDGIVDAVDLSIFLYHVKADTYEVLSIHTEINSNTTRLLPNSNLDFTRIDADNETILRAKNIILIEFIFGIPFFVTFVLLTLISRRHVKP